MADIFSFEEASGTATFSFEEAVSARRELPASVTPSQAGGGRGFVNPPLAEPQTPGFFDRISSEAGQLRDEVFSGVDSAVAGVKTLNAGMLMRREQEVEKRLQEANARGRSDSFAAQQMRSEATSLEPRIPAYVGEVAQAQAAAQRGGQMATRPAITKLNEAKTWGEAWNAFTEAPYDVIAGVTAQSLPAALPGLLAAAAMGPAAGAVTMGLNSAAVEGGSSLGEYARERGVDMTDAKAVQAFFSNRQNLSDAMSYAGKRAGIIGTLDAVSGGVAGKTLAPAMKSPLGRQAVNIPLQMGVQATLGAAGEAGAQIATKGRIDQPGQVLAEAVGEFGGAPMEVAAFSKDARAALLNRGQPEPVQSAEQMARSRGFLAPRAAPRVEDMPTTPQVPQAARAPKVEPGSTLSPDLAQQARSRISDLEGSPVDNIAALLGQKAPDASNAVAPAAEPGASPGSGRAVDAGGVQPGGFSPVAAGRTGAVQPAGTPVAGVAEAGAVAVPDSGPAPVATLNDNGTATIKGEPQSLIALLRANGVTAILPARNGVVVGKSQAEQAQRVVADFSPAQSYGGQQASTKAAPFAQQQDAASSAPTLTEQASAAPTQPQDTQAPVAERAGETAQPAAVAAPARADGAVEAAGVAQANDVNDTSTSDSFTSLPGYAQQAIGEHHMAQVTNRKVHPSPINAEWEKVTVPVESLRAKNALHFDPKKQAEYSGRKIYNTGPAVLDRNGELVDGNHRFNKAVRDGQETIEVYRPKKQGAFNAIVSEKQPATPTAVDTQPAISTDAQAGENAERSKPPRPTVDSQGNEIDRQGLTSQDRYRATVDSAATELAGQVQEESEQEDFDPADMPQVIEAWAKQSKVAADDLRSAFEKRISAASFRRKAGVLKAINPIKQAGKSGSAPNSAPAPRQRTDLESQAVDLRKRKSVLESLAKCLGG